MYKPQVSLDTRDATAANLANTSEPPLSYSRGQKKARPPAVLCILNRQPRTHKNPLEHAPMYTHINDIINLQYKIKYVVYYEHLTADKFKNTGASNEDYKIFVDVVEFVETALKNDIIVERLRQRTLMVNTLDS